MNDVQDSPQPRIAIIGIGINGLAAIKNLKEQGLKVVAFDQNPNLGGLWRWKSDPTQTTVLKSTICNTPKWFSSYTDFPFPSDYPDYPTADQIVDYLESYAKEFDLLRHCHFNVRLKYVSRSQCGRYWDLRLQNTYSEKTWVESLEQVLITTGPFSKPYSPSVSGSDGYKGTLIHSQAYKDPAAFRDKRIMVVGMSNTGCDIAVELAKVARKVYISHRSGARIVRRYAYNRPLHYALTRGRTYLMRRITSVFPRLARWILEKALERSMKPLRPEWKLLPAPPDTNSYAVLNDYVLDYLDQSKLTSVSGISHLLADSVVLDTGEEVEVDALIFATGYHFDYSALSTEANPTSHPTPEWDASPHSNGLPFPWLYQTIFHPQFSDSLAFLGPVEGYTFASFVHADLATQAIAQIWSGEYPLPNKGAMDAWCEKHYRQSLKSITKWRVPKTRADNGKLESWLNTVIGNGVEDLGWRTWWKDRKLHNLVMEGINTPFVYRLFEGRASSRESWSGARAAIEKANRL